MPKRKTAGKSEQTPRDSVSTRRSNGSMKSGRSGASVPELSQKSAPSNGRQPDGRVLPGHQAMGVETRFQPGNGNALKHGLTSRQVRDALDGAITTRAAVLRASIGADRLNEAGQSLITSFAEIETLEAMALNYTIERGGPVTSGGKVRAAARFFLSVQAAKLRLAGILGVTREARPVSIADLIEQARRAPVWDATDASGGDRTDHYRNPP